MDDINIQNSEVLIIPQHSPAPAAGDVTKQKVNQFGSVLEQNAVQAAEGFKRKGITVKDSRAS